MAAQTVVVVIGKGNVAAEALNAEILKFETIEKAFETTSIEKRGKVVVRVAEASQLDTQEIQDAIDFANARRVSVVAVARGAEDSEIQVKTGQYPPASNAAFDVIVVAPDTNNFLAARSNPVTAAEEFMILTTTTNPLPAIVLVKANPAAAPAPTVPAPPQQAVPAPPQAPVAAVQPVPDASQPNAVQTVQPVPPPPPPQPQPQPQPQLEDKPQPKGKGIKLPPAPAPKKTNENKRPARAPPAKKTAAAAKKTVVAEQTTTTTLDNDGWVDPPPV